METEILYLPVVCQCGYKTIKQSDSFLSIALLTTTFRYIAASLLAAMDARKVFPCMDEPALKAQFDVTLLRKDTKIAISNMPIIASEER